MGDLSNRSSKPQIIQAINDSRNIIANTDNFNSSGQHSFQVIKNRFQFSLQVGVVTNTGPVGDEDDYPDYRYWIQLQENRTSSMSSPTTYKLTDTMNIQDQVTSSEYASVVTAYNLNEYLQLSHGMPVGQVVSLLPVYFDNMQDSGAANFLRYIIISDLQHVIVKFGSSTAVGGIYAGTIYAGACTSVSLTGMTTGSSCIILNGPEFGSSASVPAVQASIPAQGTLIGTDEESGLPIVLTDTYSTYTCTT